MVNVESAHCELNHEISIKGLYMDTNKRINMGMKKMETLETKQTFMMMFFRYSRF